MKDETTLPTPEKNGLTFWPIPDASDPECAFGMRENRYFDRHELPEIPRKYEDAAETLFFCGGKLPEFAPQVDRTKAGRMTRALLASFAPAHESKIATVGYAFWLWSTPEALTA